MLRARRPVGFALHASFAVVSAALLVFDCSASAVGQAASPLACEEITGGRSSSSDFTGGREDGTGGDLVGPLLSVPSSRPPAKSDEPAAGPPAPDPALADSAGPGMAVGPGVYDPAWQPTSFGGWYLAPKKLRSDYFDIVFHFHAGKAAEKEYREQARGAVVVALTYGCGSKAYADAFVDPAHFQRMLDEMETRLRANRNNPRLSVRRISLFAWSAGYGAIRNILTQGYYDRIDTIVLLDGLHANYLPAAPRPPFGAPLARRVDGKLLDAFMRFSQDATDGKKQFVFTHSSIVPPGYASTTETAAVLIDVVKAKKVWMRTPAPRNLMRLYRADLGGFHIRGFSGTTKDAHIAQLHLVGEVLRDIVVPRWVRLDRRLPGQKRVPVWPREDKAKRTVAGN